MRAIATTGPATAPAINAVPTLPEDCSGAEEARVGGVVLAGWLGAGVEEAMGVGVVPGDSLETSEVTAVGVVMVAVLVSSVVEVLVIVTTDVTVCISTQF
jgi:hypothetical protein